MRYVLQEFLDSFDFFFLSIFFFYSSRPSALTSGGWIDTGNGDTGGGVICL